jgi:hypothetical protein
VPSAVYIVGAVWFCFVVTAVLLSRRYNTPIEICLFKRITGIPCPTCGSTTGGLLILQGRFLQGWLANPFVYTAVPLIGLHLLFQIVTGYSIRFRYSKRGRLVVTILLIAVILGNWGYILLRN